MALQVGELYAKLTLDKKPFDSALSQTEGQSRGWASRISGTLGSAAGALLKWGAIGGAVAGGGAFMLANSASDLNETVSKTRVVFGESADEVLSWGRDAATAMGMSQNTALSANATLGNLFVSMGLGGKEASGMSMEMVELAGDLASFNNMDPTEVLEKLRAGLVGETEPLRALGVNLNAATVEAKAMELGLWDGVGTIDAASKAQASYALILEQTGTAQGDFARTSEGMANQQRIAAATFQDTLASIGQAFVPLFEAILPQVTAGLQGFGTWVTANMPTIQAVAEAVVGAIGTGFSFLFDTILPALVAGFQTVLPIVQSVMSGAGTAIDFFTKNILPGLMSVIQGVVAWVQSNWPTISSIITQVFGAVSNVIRTVWPIIENVARVLFPMVATAAGVLFRALDGAFKLIGGAFNVLGALIRTVVTAVSGVWRTLSTVASTIFTAVSTRVSAFGTAFGRVFNGIATTARTVWNTVSSAVKGGVNFVIGLVNRLIGFLNGIRIPIPRITIPGTDIGIGGGYFDPFNIGRLPYLARGTRNFAGGFAVVGERGPEIVHLPGGSRVWPNGEGPAGGIMVNGPLVHIDNFTGSNADMDRLTRGLATRLRLRTGRSLAVTGG